MTPAAPPEGTAWKPARSGNTVRWDGSAVVKHFGERLAACEREREVLARLEGELPLPRLAVPDPTAGTLRLEYVDGIGAETVVESGHAGFLQELGRFLRNLQRIDRGSLAGALPGDGPVIAHGDFAHYNVLMADDPPGLAAVLDWEMAHLGDPIEDLAWCEWQFRNRFEHHTWALPRLFAGYGHMPEWAAREAAVQARLSTLRREAR